MEGQSQSGQIIGQWLQTHDDSQNNRLATWLETSGICMDARFETECQYMNPDYITAWAIHHKEFGGVIMKLNKMIIQTKQKAGLLSDCISIYFNKHTLMILYKFAQTVIIIMTKNTTTTKVLTSQPRRTSITIIVH